MSDICNHWIIGGDIFYKEEKMTENNGAGLYTQPIVETLRRVGLLSGRELKTRCDSDFQISQSDSSFYRCLKELKYLGFVQNTGDKYELTSFGSDLATRSDDAFFNYYLFGYILCPECRRNGNGNLVKCEIKNIPEFRRGVSVFVRCLICGYTNAPFFHNISNEEFMEIYNVI